MVIQRKLLAVNHLLRIMSLLFILSGSVFCQAPQRVSDCPTLKYKRHKVSCLCGEVQVCAGDLCGRPTDYGLDENIGVELRDKAGTTLLESKKAVVETRERKCTRGGCD